MAIRPTNLRTKWDLETEKKFFVVSTTTDEFARDTAITATKSLVEDVALPDRGDIWPQLTPLWFDDTYGTEGAWKVWENGRSIEGFLLGATNMSGQLWAENRTGRLRLYADSEVQGVILEAGDVDATDVFLPPGETQANLNAALRSSGLREDNIKVYNLTKVH